MLSLLDKIRMVPGLLPMLLEGQSFIDAQDELSVLDFMRKYGMPDTINEEIFIAMGKALDFVDPDRLSMTVILTAMNRFINEADGSQTAFLDGNQPERVCKPMADVIKGAGGDVLLDAPLAEIKTNADGSVEKLVLRSGEEVVADEYASRVEAGAAAATASDVDIPWRRVAATPRLRRGYISGDERRAAGTSSRSPST